MNLNDKYKPNTINDCYISEKNKNIINKMINRQSFKNVIIYGPIGSCKTTLINIILQSEQFKNMRIININLLFDKTVKTMHNIIEDEYHEWKRRKTKIVVIIQNLDLIEYKIQMNIHTFITKYKDISFIIETNNIINIDKLLQNDMKLIQLDYLNKDDYVNYINKICNIENVTITNDVINQLYLLTKGDIRYTLNQLSALLNVSKKITIELFEDIFTIPNSTIINDIINIIINKGNYERLKNECKILILNKFNCNEILLTLFYRLIDYELDEEKKLLLLEKLGKRIYKIYKYSTDNTNINIDDLLYTMNKLYNL